MKGGIGRPKLEVATGLQSSANNSKCLLSRVTRFVCMVMVVSCNAEKLIEKANEDLTGMEGKCIVFRCRF